MNETQPTAADRIFKDEIDRGATPDKAERLTRDALVVIGGMGEPYASQAARAARNAWLSSIDA